MSSSARSLRVTKICEELGHWNVNSPKQSGNLSSSVKAFWTNYEESGGDILYLKPDSEEVQEAAHTFCDENGEKLWAPTSKTSGPVWPRDKKM
jgi:hypothetical protein